MDFKVEISGVTISNELMDSFTSEIEYAVKVVLGKDPNVRVTVIQLGETNNDC